MPALNIEFTDDEMILIRARSAEEGVSLRRHVNDTTIEADRRDSEDSRAMAVVARLKVICAPALAELADK